MDIAKLRKRLLLLKRHADVMPPLTNAEMADLGAAFLRLTSQISDLDNSIKHGRLQGPPGKDGKTPKEDKDYLSRGESERIIRSLFADAAKRIPTPKDGVDGKDAEITEEHIKQAASLAYSMIELPNFEELITREPGAIRDALELLQDDDRLDLSAVKGLDEFQREIREQSLNAARAAGGTSPNAVQSLIDRRIIVSATAPSNPELNQLWVDVS